MESDVFGLTSVGCGSRLRCVGRNLTSGIRPQPEWRVMHNRNIPSKDMASESNRDDEFVRSLFGLLSSFPAKSLSLAVSVAALVFSLGWTTSKLITAPTGLRELAEIEAAYRQHQIEIPEKADAVFLIRYFSESVCREEPTSVSCDTDSSKLITLTIATDPEQGFDTARKFAATVLIIVFGSISRGGT